MDRVYFNEWETYPSRWLRNLYPHATVNKSDMRELYDFDFSRFNRVHFFAGIGGWEYALELAGWPKSETVWTGSCPCQPFSTAGKQTGFDDERHLWPTFFQYVRKFHPPTVFGEQVAGQLGLEWLAGVRSDLESIGYAVGAANLPAASVSSPHKRQRLFWVAHSQRRGREPKKYVNLDYSENGSMSQPTTYWETEFTIHCADRGNRRIVPEIFPLAHGVSPFVGQLSAYGNAIVPQVAAVFIRSYMEVVSLA